MQEIIEGFQLSPQQYRLWQLHNDHSAYYSECLLLLEGELDQAELQHAIHAAVQRHEIYQTYFHRLPGMKQPLQVIHETDLFSWQHLDLSSLPTWEQADVIKHVAQQEQRRPIDLAHGPLLHLSLLELAQQKHLLFLHTLALCADLRTLQFLAHDIAERYHHSLFTGDTDEVVQYLQFSEWQNTLFDDEESTLGRQAWQQKDFSTLSTWSLPGEELGDVEQPFTFAQQALQLDHATHMRLETLAQQAQQTPDLLLLACWQILLGKLTGRSAFLLGKSFDERIYEDLAETAGPLTTYLPLSCHLHDEQSFLDVVMQAKTALQEAQKWQSYFRWDDIQQASELAFFPFSFDFQVVETKYPSPTLVITLQSLTTCSEPFKVKLQVFQQAHQLTLEFHYHSGLFNSSVIERLIDQFQTLLEQVLAQPERPIATFTILSQGALHQLLREFNATEAAFPDQSCLHDLFEAQALRTPELVAVADGEQRLTYAELERQTNQLAHYLQRLGVGPDIPVGVCLERSTSALVAILGILKAGGAYVPLDIAYPSERLAFIIDETHMPVILTLQHLREIFPCTIQRVALDHDWSEIAQ